ncbi:hypothetical protein RxyAA322_24950 [Rubrobacter xylanophilus]|uniref:Uncharacterized protein n=1 Tax=Rubrobacter xylanophilus TaxID=49319 RepID=A0A510HKT3_9ACTN|nr:hypothetical protein RxyAA322_24950 [Rubrobacter xylanophilus]
MSGGAPTVSTLIYVGSLAVSNLRLPPGSNIVPGRDELLRIIHRRRPPRTLVILDPGSFPFEELPAEWWDVPLGVSLISREETEKLIRRSGEAVLGRLGFFDRVAVRDPGIWRALSASYVWDEGQLVECGETDPETLAARLCAAVEGVVEKWGWNAKAVHRTRDAALERFLDARKQCLDGGVLQICAEDGRWAQTFLQRGQPFTFATEDNATPGTFRRNYPASSSSLLETNSGSSLMPETFGLVFGESLLQKGSLQSVARLVSRMWNLARSGCCLAFLDDFVFEHGEGVSIKRFVELVNEATERRVVLDHIESLRYPGDEIYRGALLVFKKLGLG